MKERDAGVEVAKEPEIWFPNPEDLDLAELLRLGRILDRRPVSLKGKTVLTAMAAGLLQVRTHEGKTEALRANPVQRAFEGRRGAKNIVLKARQMGLTTWVAARFFLKTITQPGTLTLQVAHTREAAEAIFEIVRRFLDCLPQALRQGPLKTSRSNARGIGFSRLDAQYLVVSAGERNAGRGLTVQNLHCSELARWPGNAGETLAGLRAALSPKGELILESTPDGVGGYFHQEWMRAEETGTVRHFFPWWMEGRYKAQAVSEASLTEEEKELVARHHLDLEQIGYRRQMRADYRRLAAQEFAEDAESCFSASGESVFELTALEERLRAVPEPEEKRHNGELEIWLPPVKGKTYVVAVDPAEGGCDGDYSAVEVVDFETGLQCAEFAGHVGGLELAQLVTGLASEYQKAWLAVERNGPGSGVLSHAEGTCKYARIYRQKEQPGWRTDSMSRPAMLNRLDAALVEAPDCFLSRKLLAECRSFVRFRDGHTGARPGMHDDRVMAMAIALAVRAEMLERPGAGNRE